MKTDKRSKKRELVRVSECLYKLKPYGKYYGQARHHGKLFRESLKTDDRQLAERRLKDFLERVGKVKPGTGGITFEQVLNIWRTNDFEPKSLKPGARRYRELCIDGLKRSWPGLWSLPARKITEADCKAWFVKRREVISPSLLNNEVSTLRMVLERGIREGIISKNPTIEIGRVKILKKEVVIPTQNQFVELVQHLRQRKNFEAAEFVELLAFSGMRVGEAAEILWKDVDFEKGKFTVTGGEKLTKNSEIRKVPLFPALRDLFQRIQKDRLRAKPEDRIMRILQCHMAIGNACKKLGFPHFNHHAFRHFFASHACEAGVDFKTISNWLGHSDGGILVAQIYSHLRETHSEAMAEKMTFDASAESLNATV